MLDHVLEATILQSGVGRLTVTPLKTIAAALDAMSERGIQYCHWKSNYHIEYAVTGREDVDILIGEAGDKLAYITVPKPLGHDAAATNDENRRRIDELPVYAARIFVMRAAPSPAS